VCYTYYILYCIVVQNAEKVKKPKQVFSTYTVFSLNENSEIVTLYFFSGTPTSEVYRTHYYYNTRHIVCTFHNNLRAIAVRDDLHAFAQKPNAVVCRITAGTHNNTIYIALLLLLSSRSYARDIYGISRLADAIPTMYYIILFLLCRYDITCDSSVSVLPIPIYIILLCS